MPQIQIEAIDWNRVEEAVGVLSRAFAGDAAMRYFFGGADDVERRVQALFRFSCQVRLDRREPLLGAVVDGRLAGVACVSDPDAAPWSEGLERAWERCQQEIGEAAVRRLDIYEGVQTRNALPDPHLYVIALAVDPPRQGTGCGTALLDHIQCLSETHVRSVGVALDTESDENVRFYKNRGFHVTGGERIDETDIWFLYRPNRSESSKQIPVARGS